MSMNAAKESCLAGTFPNRKPLETKQIRFLMRKEFPRRQETHTLAGRCTRTDNFIRVAICPQQAPGPIGLTRWRSKSASLTAVAANRRIRAALITAGTGT
jgi:hypothetical protein